MGAIGSVDLQQKAALLARRPQSRRSCSGYQVRVDSFVNRKVVRIGGPALYPCDVMGSEVVDQELAVYNGHSL